MPKSRSANVVALAPQPISASAEIALLAGWEPSGAVEIELADGRRVKAESTLTLDRGSLAQAVSQRRRVLVIGTRDGTYVVTGLLQETLRVGRSDQEIQVRVEGDRLVLQGRQEVELRCGEASIVLRRDGELVLRGTRIASRSRGPNVLTGATIRLN